MILLKTKNFLYVFILLAYACGQKTKPTDNNVETQLDTAAKTPVEVVRDTNTVNFPCSPNIVKTKNYKNDTKGFFVRLTSICLDDNAIIDTLQNTDERLVLAQNSNYKHEVFLQTGKDSAAYTITKDLVKVDGIIGNEVLINPQMPKTAFDQKDNSVTINFTFSPPNATTVRKVKFKVLLKGGVKFVGVVEDKE